MATSHPWIDPFIRAQQKEKPPTPMEVSVTTREECPGTLKIFNPGWKDKHTLQIIQEPHDLNNHIAHTLGLCVSTEKLIELHRQLGEYIYDLAPVPPRVIRQVIVTKGPDNTAIYDIDIIKGSFKVPAIYEKLFSDDLKILEADISKEAWFLGKWGDLQEGANFRLIRGHLKAMERP